MPRQSNKRKAKERKREGAEERRSRFFLRPPPFPLRTNAFLSLRFFGLRRRRRYQRRPRPTTCNAPPSPQGGAGPRYVRGREGRQDKQRRLSCICGGRREESESERRGLSFSSLPPMSCRSFALEAEGGRGGCHRRCCRRRPRAAPELALAAAECRRKSASFSLLRHAAARQRAFAFCADRCTSSSSY